ncbi:MAG: hypothetical protein M1825_006441 [Sarcosagium campestre]|nr:MAG: hypothetical protein M1825_006441 [Sarcosagium campestre]
MPSRRRFPPPPSDCLVLSSNPTVERKRQRRNHLGPNNGTRSRMHDSKHSYATFFGRSLQSIYVRLPEPAKQYLETAGENDSVDPLGVLGATVLGLLILAAISMSGWSRRFLGGGGRFSPFAAAEFPPQVTSNDYSYITEDDVVNSPYDSHANPRSPLSATRPSSSDDSLRLKVAGKIHERGFPPYSIDDGILTIGNVRDEAAKVAGISNPRRVKLLYKGKNLKDDNRPCREEGLKMDSEIHCMLSDEPEGTTSSLRPGNSNSLEGSSASSSGDEAGGAGAGGDGAAAPRKKRNRGRAKKTQKSVSETASSSNLAPPGLAPPDGSSRATSRSRSPAASKTALEKLDELASHFSTKLLPDCVQFTSNPPSDPVKREHEHRKLTETILSQVLLKLDAVETDGDDKARQRRKDLVKQTQGVLNGLDAIVKGE